MPEIHSKGTDKRNKMSMEPIIGTISKKVENNRTIQKTPNKMHPQHS